MIHRPQRSCGAARKGDAKGPGDAVSGWRREAIRSMRSDRWTTNRRFILMATRDIEKEAEEEQVHFQNVITAFQQYAPYTVSALVCAHVQVSPLIVLSTTDS